MRPRLLLTGFGPFPGAPRNPTAEVAERIARRGDVALRVEIAVRILPTTWAAVDAFADVVAETEPDAALLLGLARRAREIRIERFARDRAAVSAVDADGARPRPGGLSGSAGSGVGRIASSGADPADAGPWAARAPVRAMAAAVAASGVATRLGDDAGAYLCNALFRRALAALGTRPVAFLHLPPTADVRPASRFRVTDLERAVAAAIPPLVAAIGRRRETSGSQAAAIIRTG